MTVFVDGQLLDQGDTVLDNHGRVFVFHDVLENDQMLISKSWDLSITMRARIADFPGIAIVE